MGILQETAARLTLREMEDLITAAETTKAAKIEWRPMDSGRHVLDLIIECGAVNARWAEILDRRQWVEWPLERVLERQAKLRKLKDACDQLRRDTELYVASLGALPDEDLELVMKLPWGERRLADCLTHAAMHMSYHEGQIAYIQTLYGDWTRY